MMLKELSKEPAKAEEAPFAAAFKAQLEKLQTGDPELQQRQTSLSQLSPKSRPGGRLSMHNWRHSSGTFRL